jgi:hypothetical protein
LSSASAILIVSAVDMPLHARANMLTTTYFTIASAAGRDGGPG